MCVCVCLNACLFGLYNIERPSRQLVHQCRVLHAASHVSNRALFDVTTAAECSEFLTSHVINIKNTAGTQGSIQWKTAESMFTYPAFE